MPRISVVVPVYKAESCLEELYRRLRLSLETITPDFEILLVEDCGGDRSWEMIQALARSDSRVKGYQFSRNFGQHYGITAGLDHCDADWVVVMDCDLQDRPEEIPNLYAKAREGFDVVVARRHKRKHPVWKRATSWVFYRVFGYLSGLHYDHRVGNFRIMSRKVVAQFRKMREELRFFGALMDWLGFPAATIEVEHSERFEGKTTYTYGKLLGLAADAILAHSDKPLKLAINLGFCVTAAAFAYGAFVVFKALAWGIPVSGWASLIVSLYFLGGIIIAILGMIGVYLGKTFDQTKQRPLYVINRSTADLDSDGTPA